MPEINFILSENEILQAIILGLVQGASEFLPISSSGHLILVPRLLGWEGIVNSLSFSVALHFGTTIAVLVFFWKDWWSLSKSFLRNLPQGFGTVWKENESRIFILLVLGSLPAGVVGFLFEDYFENQVRNPSTVALVLIIFALVLFLADKIGRRERKFEDVTWGDTLSVGLAQALALIPGVSRSGITITSGLFRGLDRKSATRFSFLLSTPTIVGAAVFKLKDIDSISRGADWVLVLVGVFTAAFSGWLAIKLLLKFVEQNNFNLFVIYRIVLGIGVFVWLFVQSYYS